MRTVVITFKGVPGSERCLRARQTLRQHGGAVRATSLFCGAGECDLEVALPDDTVTACMAVLERDGYIVVLYPPD